MFIKDTMLAETLKNSFDGSMRSNLLFGEWLIEQGLIDAEQLSAALADQKSSGHRLGR